MLQSGASRATIAPPDTGPPAGPSTRPSAIPVDLKVLDELTNILSKLITRKGLNCPDEFKQEVLWIAKTAYDGEKMLSDIQHALQARKLSIEWLIHHLNALRQERQETTSGSFKSFEGTVPESSTAGEQCICGDPDCDSEQESVDENIFQDGVARCDTEDPLLKRSQILSRFAHLFDMPGPSMTSLRSFQGTSPPSNCEGHTVPPLKHVMRIKGGLFASPTPSGGVIVTDSLTPSTEPGLYARLPYLPSALLQDTATSSNDGIISAVSRPRKPSQASILTTTSQPNVRFFPRLRRLGRTVAVVLWPIIFPFLVLGGIYLVMAIINFSLEIQAGLHRLQLYAGMSNFNSAETKRI
ncbi:hypothetical protein M422DRAFT_46192 [Sphaerobolus stellatus SS14]|nr:hypothetical protein M422DRAFT_46192 [Sphaerobolus stellatus SS14]